MCLENCNYLPRCELFIIYALTLVLWNATFSVGGILAISKQVEEVCDVWFCLEIFLKDVGEGEKNEP